MVDFFQIFKKLLLFILCMLFTDCGPSQDIPNTVKSVDKVANVDSDTIVEQIVSYTCIHPYFLLPEAVDTTRNCVNGSWVYNDFQCLQS